MGPERSPAGRQKAFRETRSSRSSLGTALFCDRSEPAGQFPAVPVAFSRFRLVLYSVQGQADIFLVIDFDEGEVHDPVP
jgi:hypothetical protein